MALNTSASAHPHSRVGGSSATAYSALKLGFTVAPIVAGLDKFFNVLTDWTVYVAPTITNLLGVTPSAFMMVVGVIEVIAGILVAVKPRIGGMVVAAWLGGIILNLVIHPLHYWDIALRDLGLLIGAFSLSMLAADREREG